MAIDKYNHELYFVQVTIEHHEKSIQLSKYV